MRYYKWIEEGLEYEGYKYTYYIEDGSRISYNIKENKITQAFLYFIRENVLYFHWIGAFENDSINLINTLYKSNGDINIIRGIFTYRYKELLNDNIDKYYTRFCKRLQGGTTI